jgi:FMN-dependent NADH-azoreductase
VLTARGSDYSHGGPLHAMDFQETYLRTIFGFIGVTDVTFMHCQGVAAGDDAREVQLARSLAMIKGAFADVHATG